MPTNPNAPVEIPRDMLEKIRNLIADVEHYTLRLTREAATVALETPTLKWSGKVTTSDLKDSVHFLTQAQTELAMLVRTAEVIGIDPVRLYAEYRNL